MLSCARQHGVEPDGHCPIRAFFGTHSPIDGSGRDDFSRTAAVWLAWAER
jgi:hypothetical protein